MVTLQMMQFTAVVLMLLALMVELFALRHPDNSAQGSALGRVIRMLTGLFQVG